MRLAVDLLTPTKLERVETQHTQALAYALNSAQHHGFGNDVLLAIVRRVLAGHGRVGAARILRLVEKSGTNLFVQPEYHFRIEGRRDRSIARSDIWIEAHNRKKSAVVVIENKIDAAESRDQLTWYERKVTSWCKTRGHTRSLLVLLSPEGREAETSRGDDWVPLSYLELASALREVWIARRKSLGADWLAMYIASITRGLLGIDLRRAGSVTIEQIQTYKTSYAR